MGKVYFTIYLWPNNDVNKVIVARRAVPQHVL